MNQKAPVFMRELYLLDKSIEIKTTQQIVDEIIEELAKMKPSKVPLSSPEYPILRLLRALRSWGYIKNGSSKLSPAQRKRGQSNS